LSEKKNFLLKFFKLLLDSRVYFGKRLLDCQGRGSLGRATKVKGLFRAEGRFLDSKAMLLLFGWLSDVTAF
jgi:hypothetical protein